jgi:oligopeptide transport system ATP-binding protein
MINNNLIVVENLTKSYSLDKKNRIAAVRNVSFEIAKGEIFGLVGESGSGKTTLARQLMHMEKPDSGKIYYRDLELTDNRVYRSNRRKVTQNIQMIFQNPYASVNLRKRVEEIVGEPLIVKNGYRMPIGYAEKIEELLTMVGINPSFKRRFPKEFSGGQLQRICVARAMALDPEFIVADEPVSSLDVSIQAQIVNLFKKLQKNKNLTCLFIAHDLSMVHFISDRIGVMYQGQIVELAEARELFVNPVHHYTKYLVSAIPVPDPHVRSAFIPRDSLKDISENSQWREYSNNHFVLIDD